MKGACKDGLKVQQRCINGVLKGPVLRPQRNFKKVRKICVFIALKQSIPKLGKVMVKVFIEHIVPFGFT